MLLTLSLQWDLWSCINLDFNTNDQTQQNECLMYVLSGQLAKENDLAVHSHPAWMKMANCPCHHSPLYSLICHFWTCTLLLTIDFLRALVQWTYSQDLWMAWIMQTVSLFPHSLGQPERISWFYGAHVQCSAAKKTSDLPGINGTFISFLMSLWPPAELKRTQIPLRNGICGQSWTAVTCFSSTKDERSC